MSLIVIVVLAVVLLVVLGLSAIPTIVAIVVARRKVSDHREFLARAVRTPATMAQAPPNPPPPQGAPIAAPIAIYYAPDGSTLQARIPATPSELFSQGQPVELLVDPTRPARVFLASRAGEPVRTGGTIAIGIVISVVVLIPLLVIGLFVALFIAPIALFTTAPGASGP
jgi:hypothetical protein